LGVTKEKFSKPKKALISPQNKTGFHPSHVVLYLSFGAIEKLFFPVLNICAIMIGVMAGIMRAKRKTISPAPSMAKVTGQSVILHEGNECRY